jgi:hypothetical protein
MSLINDALKRARQVQQNQPQPAASSLRFRPIDPAQHPRKGMGLVLPATLTTILAVGLFSLWHLNQDAHAPAAPMTQPPQARSKAAEPSRTAAANAVRPTPASPAGNAMVPARANTPAVVAAATPPKPDPLKLQGILFSPNRPSAMIGGKTVFVGDQLGEFHVAAIASDSATLISDTQTNVLKLE